MPDAIQNHFIQSEGLIRHWLSTICQRYAKRIEMEPPSYEACIADMARNGWDDGTLITALNKQTNGRFCDDPDIQLSDDFPSGLHAVFRRALSHHAQSGKESTDPSLDTKKFLLECASTQEEALSRRRQDVESPNSKAGALSFADRVIARAEFSKDTSRGGSTLH